MQTRAPTHTCSTRMHARNHTCRRAHAPAHAHPHAGTRALAQAHDSNMFNRWEQAQVIHKRQIVELYSQLPAAAAATSAPGPATSAPGLAQYIDVLASILTDDALDASLKSSMLGLPRLEEMIMTIADCDPVRLHAVTTLVATECARSS